MPTVFTRHQWFDELERIQPYIGTLKLKEKFKDKSYTKQAGSTSHLAYKDAFKLSNSLYHNAVVVRAVAALYQKCSDVETTDMITTMLGNLTSRNTYGTFCELAVYAWLADNNIAFEPQVEMTALQVLNPNGCTLDGKLDSDPQKPTFFDIKAFGFYEHKIGILKSKLDQEFGERTAAIEGTWDISVNFLEDLLGKDFTALVEELKVTRNAKRGLLEISIRAPSQNFMQAHATTPRKLAWENRSYPLNYAKQFTRAAPFLLVFVIHPWFSQGDLHQNFGGYTDLLAQNLAYQAFFSFTGDATLECGLARKDLVKHLSGLMYLNIWPMPISAIQGPVCRIYLNSLANHRFTHNDFAQWTSALGGMITIDELYQ